MECLRQITRSTWFGIIYEFACIHAHISTYVDIYILCYNVTKTTYTARKKRVTKNKEATARGSSNNLETESAWKAARLYRLEFYAINDIYSMINLLYSCDYFSPFIAIIYYYVNGCYLEKQNARGERSSSLAGHQKLRNLFQRTLIRNRMISRVIFHEIFFIVTFFFLKFTLFLWILSILVEKIHVGFERAVIIQNFAQHGAISCCN